MTNQAVVDLVSNGIAVGSTLSAIAEEMTNHCLARDGMDGIGCDNMSVIIISLLHGTEPEEWSRKIAERVVNTSDVSNAN